MNDYRMETLDANDLVLRVPSEGQIKSWMSGKSLAWVPDRREGEEKLRVVREADGLVLSVAWLTDDRTALEAL